MCMFVMFAKHLNVNFRGRHPDLQHRKRLGKCNQKKETLIKQA